jgi:hypothetical protein
MRRMCRNTCSSGFPSRRTSVRSTCYVRTDMSAASPLAPPSDPPSPLDPVLDSPVACPAASTTASSAVAPRKNRNPLFQSLQAPRAILRKEPVLTMESRTLRNLLPTTDPMESRVPLLIRCPRALPLIVQHPPKLNIR